MSPQAAPQFTPHSPVPTPVPTPWAAHLVRTRAGIATPLPGLTTTEAARVQRHRDQLLAALRARDRVALGCAKQQVLAAAFCAPGEHRGADAQDSPALRRALRELCWCMAALVLPRGPGH